MKTFKHFNARSVSEAVQILSRYGGRAAVIAGGTDLLGKMKDRILPEYPEALVNIKPIPGLDAIKEESGMLRIGVLARLHDISQSAVVSSRYTALAQAAARAASPNLRHMGTIGGNICQDIRCWYYRAAGNRFSCLRKGGGRCYAIKGDNRYHSIFGGSVEGGCVAVHPSDVAPALVALDATVVTDRRTIGIEDFFAVGPVRTTVLEKDEIVIEIRVPAPPEGSRSSFVKFAQRRSIDFPIVNCAALVTGSAGRAESSRICLNAVWVNPYRAVDAEKAVAGRPLNAESAAESAEAAVRAARPLEHNGYMVSIARAMVKRALLACGEGRG